MKEKLALFGRIFFDNEKWYKLSLSQKIKQYAVLIGVMAIIIAISIHCFENLHEIGHQQILEKNDEVKHEIIHDINICSQANHENDSTIIEIQIGDAFVSENDYLTRKHNINKLNISEKASIFSILIGVIAIMLAIFLHVLNNKQAKENQQKVEEKIDETKKVITRKTRTSSKFPQENKPAVIGVQINDANKIEADNLAGKEINIKNSNFAGRDIVINQISHVKLDELIKLFNFRARIINKNLHKHFKYTKVRNYLKEFNEIHKKHIEALQKNELILAHEYLTTIHDISYKICYEEFWTRHKKKTPFIRYKLSPDAFTKGELICGYIAGDLAPYSKKYLNSIYMFFNERNIYSYYEENKNMDNEKSIDRILVMYELILKNT